MGQCSLVDEWKTFMENTQECVVTRPLHSSMCVKGVYRVLTFTPWQSEWYSYVRLCMKCPAQLYMKQRIVAQFVAFK